MQPTPATLPAAPRTPPIRWLVTACLMVFLVPTAGHAQRPPPPLPAITDSATTAPTRGASPGGAFLRAVLVPGWGHASIGAYRRGAFYFVAESATAWAMIKARQRVQEAGRRIDFRESLVRQQLTAGGVTDPEDIQTALDDDETLTDLRSLEEARRQQREDWTALGIFLLFLSGADAYVSAHLQRFPTPIEIDARPVGNGRMELSVGVTLPR